MQYPRHLSSFLYLLIAPFLFFHANSEEQHVSAAVLPERLSISTSSHPAVIEYFQPWVKNAYAKLGIEVEFLSLNEERSLLLLQNGDIDGDIIRTEQVLLQLESVVPVYMLGEAKIYLICRPNLICNNTTLNNPDLILGSVAGNTYFQTLLHEKKITQMRYTTYQLLRQSYLQKRVDTYIEISNSYEIEMPFPEKAGIFKLGQMQGFHLLYEKHRHLVPLVAAQLESIKNNQ